MANKLYTNVLRLSIHLKLALEYLRVNIVTMLKARSDTFEMLDICLLQVLDLKCRNTVYPHHIVWLNVFNLRQQSIGTIKRNVSGDAGQHMCLSHSSLVI